MRNKLLFIGLLLSVLLFSGCGVTAKHTLLEERFNQQTDVVLSKNNFIVVKTARGEAKATYNSRGKSKPIKSKDLKIEAGENLITEARRKMIEDANLDGKPRIIINERVEETTYEEHNQIIGKVVVVTAQVIEFTD